MFGPHLIFSLLPTIIILLYFGLWLPDWDSPLELDMRRFDAQIVQS
jgi:hypothetical protein